MRSIFALEFRSFVAKKRFFALRAALAAGALGIFWLAAIDRTYRLDRLGRDLFTASAFGLIVLAALFAPAVLAPVFVEEKKLGKLDVLRSAPISAGGIVFGKWLARSAILALVVLAIFPFTAVSVLFGGVMPWHLPIPLVIALATLAWTSAAGLFAGARAKEVGGAILVAYTLVAVVLGSALGGVVLAQEVVGRANAPWFFKGAMHYAVATNPFAALDAAAGASGSNSPFFRPYANDAWWYLVFAAALTTLFLGATVLSISRDARPGRRRWRRAAAIDCRKDEAEANAPTSAAEPLRLPPVARGRDLRRRPELWLELSRGRKAAWSIVRAAQLVVLLILESIWLIALISEKSRRGWRSPVRLQEYAAIHFGAVATALGLALIVAVVGGSVAVHRDGELRTREVLFTTPLASRRLAFAKLVGAIRPAVPLLAIGAAHALFAAVLGDLTAPRALATCLIGLVIVLGSAVFCMRLTLRAKGATAAIVLGLGAFAAVFLALPLATLIIVDNETIRFGETRLPTLFFHPTWWIALAVLPEIEPYWSEHLENTPAWIALCLWTVAALRVGLFGLPVLYERLREDELAGGSERPPSP